MTLSGNNANRVLRVNPGNALTVKGLTIADCQIANLGAGISFSGSGVLRIIDSTLQDNVSSASGAGLFLDPDPKADGTFAVHVSTSEPLTSWPTLTKIRSRWTKTRKSGSQILRSNPQRKGGLISI